MGLLFSREETVITVWKKHEHDIMEQARTCAATFIEKYCEFGQGFYTENRYVFVFAFTDYLKKNMSPLHWDAFMYNTSISDRFHMLFDSRYDIMWHPRDIIVGVKLLFWP